MYKIKEYIIIIQKKINVNLFRLKPNILIDIKQRYK